MNSGLTSHQQVGHTETDLSLKSYPRTKKKKAENRACDPLIGTRALHPRSTVTGKIQEKEMGNNIKGRIGMDTANGNQREIKVNP